MSPSHQRVQSLFAGLLALHLGLPLLFVAGCRDTKPVAASPRPSLEIELPPARGAPAEVRASAAPEAD